MKKIAAIQNAPPTHWVGDGFPVRTVISPQNAAAVSPFLLLDHAGPAEFPPTEELRGVEEHPHKGFETVTIVYQGELEHRDSAGNQGRIGAGDVQWMTAAAGVLHEEMHSRDFARQGGTLEMVQLWVNLPAKDKSSPPGYQTILSSQIPVVQLEGGAGTARVIAGEFGGTKGPARTFTAVNVWDLRLRRGGRVESRVPDGNTAALFVLRGSVSVNGEPAAGDQLVVFEPDGDQIAIEARDDATLLVLSGQPIDEPIVSYGPFVMNTQDEIRQAIADYRAGRFGQLN